MARRGVGRNALHRSDAMVVAPEPGRHLGGRRKAIRQVIEDKGRGIQPDREGVDSIGSDAFVVRVVWSNERRPIEGCPVIGASDRKVPTARYRRATRRRRKKKKKAQATNLKAGASGVALLLLGTIVGRRLASRALSSRRFALAASHCAALLVDARGGFGDEVEKKVVEINRREKLCGCGG